MSERYMGEEGMISACMQAKNDSIVLATQLHAHLTRLQNLLIWVTCVQRLVDGQITSNQNV